MFALIDCNNFFVSCERLFRPDLEKKAVVVLSNNDGCAISRSDEAKELGIKMGEPYFKFSARKNVTIFSSNFTLYGDLSWRVMSIIREAWPEIEVYSIDECFIDLSSMQANLHDSFCTKLQKRILKTTGIPTTIGIGKTKTLAKLANFVAKRKLSLEVLNFNELAGWFDKINIGEVWGIGKSWQLALHKIKIYNITDFMKAEPSFIKKSFSVVMQRIYYELKGLSCLELEEITPKQMIMSSRSFSNMQPDLLGLEEATSSFLVNAWRKLRQGKQLTQHVTVFIKSNKHRCDLGQYSNFCSMKLIHPSDDLIELTKIAKQLLRKIYKKGFLYKKAGISLEGLIPNRIRQADLLNETSNSEKQQKINDVMEKINNTYGNNSVFLATNGIKPSWQGKKQMISPRYTTNWNELAWVK